MARSDAAAHRVNRLALKLKKNHPDADLLDCGVRASETCGFAWHEDCEHLTDGRVKIRPIWGDSGFLGFCGS